ncbi:MAG TPA: sigma-54-dependent Fis family transcriptional regulator, partial [Planctomycetes bacterium]|nr:sigma-54-dependent Fis family transcriptional regulator [Planctomycetota bacterium]
MKAEDLDLRELLEFQPEGGLLHFAGQRALLFDAAALGLLRKELIDTLGLSGARGVLTRFGFAHGWRTAETLRRAFPWDDAGEWRRAGGRLHTLQGLVIVEGLPGQGEGGRPFAEALWHESFEAEQHLLQRGRAEAPVCWSLSGYASGYLSYSNDAEIYCVESQCVARGDSVCRFAARSRSEWGEAIEAHLPYYERDCLDETLRQTRDALAQARKRLRAQRRRLDPDTRQALDPSGIVARSASMQAVLDLARRTAQVDTTVLVTGESGVGKERVSRLIHAASPRTGGPFVPVNCGAIAPQLLESELFG